MMCFKCKKEIDAPEEDGMCPRNFHLECWLPVNNGRGLRKSEAVRLAVRERTERTEYERLKEALHHMEQRISAIERYMLIKRRKQTTKT